MYVCLCVRYAHHLLVLGSCYVVHIDAIVNIVYFERNNMQVELIRFHKKISTLLTLGTLKWEYTFRPTCLRNYP